LKASRGQNEDFSDTVQAFPGVSSALLNIGAFVLRSGLLRILRRRQWELAEEIGGQRPQASPFAMSFFG
jgi:hypothetical protein